MCGITGLFLNTGKTIFHANLRETITRMADSLSNRGPDMSGCIINSSIAFGHRRLSILDLGETGRQPMLLGINDSIITYNGEIYNFQELRHLIGDAEGYVWRGNSDTEVILRTYAKWGLEGLKRLEGIFAFALWDPSKQRLVLMRDRLGVKPLFYGECQYGLAFGSEMKAILAAGGVDTSLDHQAFSEYLWYGNTHGRSTFYKGVRSLEPGHWLIIENGNRKVEPWWRIEEWLERPVEVNNPADAAALVREALDNAVARQLVADVPIGLFLSGGIDSSSIAAAAMMQRLEPLQSYTAGFDYALGLNETHKAAQIAKQLGLNHHTLKVSGSKLESVLLTLARAHDEPFADAANIPLYLMCQQLQGQVKVVLQGDGGDELFGGYRRYAILRNHKYWKYWPKLFSRLTGSFGSAGRRFKRMVDSVGHHDPAMQMALLLTIETLDNSPELILSRDQQINLMEKTDPFLAYKQSADRFRAYDPVQQMLLTDLTVQLPSQFLTKVDRATMAAGIEARVPLLDDGLVRLVVNWPSEWKVKGVEKKILLRNSQRGRLPDDILDGEKTGFGVPYEEWLRTSLFEFTRSHLMDRAFIERFGFQEKKIDQMLLLHRMRKVDRGFTLWKLLQLSIWNSQAKTDSGINFIF